jgi:D-alanine-D-alanine ligase
MAAMRALNITNIGRFDGFVTSDSQVIITDPNTLSGMGPASFLFREAAELNMSHTDVINHLIETELHYYGMLDAILERERKELAAMNTPKIRVAVLMGGASNEREISLESGRNVCYKLSPHKYSITPIFVNQSMELYTLNQSQLVRNCTKEISQCVDESQKISWGQLPHLVDFVFIALHGGEGENGSVQGTLEMLGIPYNGSSVLASALCMDKFKTTQFLHSKGFDVPQAMLISAHEWRADREACKATIMQKIGLPIIVKPHDDGCSVMVQKVKRESDIINAIEILFASGKEHALVEECIVGMELTVGVIGNDTPRALPPSQAVCAADILSIEEKFLPGAGENQTPAPLPQHTLTFVQRIVESTYKALGCKGYSRIDCFYQTAEQSRTGKERVVIIENNSLPGLTPATCIFHQAAELGIKPMDFIDTIVQLGIEEHSKHTQKDIPPRVSV